MVVLTDEHARRAEDAREVEADVKVADGQPVIVGGPMRYEGGAIRVPDTPGLGVELDREKLRRYHELYRELGGYPYDRDPGRPGW